MPEAFENCVAAGGKVRTKSLPEGQYVRGCSQDGENWHWGELKKKKNPGKTTLRQASGIAKKKITYKPKKVKRPSWDKPATVLG